MDDDNGMPSNDRSLTTIPVPVDGRRSFEKIFAYVEDWCNTHQWQVGVAEMSVGAALIAAGLQSGALQMGVDVIASTFSDEVTARALGGVAGTVLGGLPGFVLGSIGVVAAGSAVGLPAILLIGSGALVLGLAGYGAGALVESFLHPVPALAEVALSGTLAAVGIALVIDGARRVCNDPSVGRLAAAMKKGVLRVARVHASTFITSLADLHSYLDAEFAPFVAELSANPKSAAAMAALTAIGVVGGQAVAVGSVTVLGSSSLGALGLSLGLVSAPLWPVIAGGGLALTVAYCAWRAARSYGSAPDNPRLNPVALGTATAPLSIGMEPKPPA